MALHTSSLSLFLSVLDAPCARCNVVCFRRCGGCNHWSQQLVAYDNRLDVGWVAEIGYRFFCLLRKVDVVVLHDWEEPESLAGPSDMDERSRK